MYSRARKGPPKAKDTATTLKKKKNYYWHGTVTHMHTHTNTNCVSCLSLCVQCMSGCARPNKLCGLCTVDCSHVGRVRREGAELAAAQVRREAPAPRQAFLRHGTHTERAGRRWHLVRVRRGLLQQGPAALSG